MGTGMGCTVEASATLYQGMGMGCEDMGMGNEHGHGYCAKCDFERAASCAAEDPTACLEQYVHAPRRLALITCSIHQICLSLVVSLLIIDVPLGSMTAFAMPVPMVTGVAHIAYTILSCQCCIAGAA